MTLAVLPTPAFLLGALAVLLASRLFHGWLGAFSRVPSTLLHELCHYLVAYVTGSRPAPMDIVPKRSGDDWVLGSVRFHAGTFSAAFVALAPLLLLGVAWACWPTSQPVTSFAWQVLQGAVFAWSLQGAWPSGVDWEVAFRHPLGLALLGGVVTLFLHSWQVL